MSLLQERPLGAFVPWSDFKSASKARVTDAPCLSAPVARRQHVAPVGNEPPVGESPPEALFSEAVSKVE